MNAALEALAFQFRFGLGRAVGAVGKDIARGIGLHQQVIELLTVVNGGIAHVVTPNEFVFGVSVDVILVTVKGLAMLLGSARVFILLPVLCVLFFPSRRRLAGLDGVVVFA